MDNGGVNGAGSFEMEIVIAPVMRQIGADEDDIAGVEAFDMIAHELGAAALVKNDQLHFGMIMPAVINEWVPVFPDTERLSGSLGDF